MARMKRSPAPDHGGHDHDHSHASIKAAPEVRTALAILVGLVVLLTAIGLLIWRPDGSAPSFPSPGDRVNATVISDEPQECELFGFGSPDSPAEDDVDDTDGFFDDLGGADEFDSLDPFDFPPGECVQIAFEVTSGPNEGGIGSFQLHLSTEQVAPTFSVGDKIVVNEFQLGDTGIWDYTFADRQRSTPMVWLAVLFVVAVLALGRFQGVRALAGLVASVAVIFLYVLPALLEGLAPLPVAIVAASLIAFASLYFTHGFNDTTTVALLGTLSALGLTGVLATIFTAATQISGLESDDQRLLAVFGEGIDFRGLVLAGIVIGTLGVLDDVTVTQVSAVARLREANPTYTARQLYSAGVHIGRDHIAATVNTLVLAYAGAALPLFLYYTNIGMPLAESITQEIIAVEVVRTLVGSIGLVAAVPITTGLAAIVVSGTGAKALRFLPALPTTKAGRADRSS